MSGIHDEVLAALDDACGREKIDATLPEARAHLGGLRRAYHDTGKPTYAHALERLASVDGAPGLRSGALGALAEQHSIRVVFLGAGREPSSRRSSTSSPSASRTRHRHDPPGTTTARQV